jgi:hypothetical protein
MGRTRSINRAFVVESEVVLSVLDQGFPGSWFTIVRVGIEAEWATINALGEGAFKGVW